MQRVDEHGEADPDVAGANLYKLLANSAVGKFAQAVHRFTKTRIIGPDKLRKCFQDATFKNYKPLRSEDVLIDPLYEVCHAKKMVTENLALHIQIQVYQACDNFPFFKRAAAVWRRQAFKKQHSYKLTPAYGAGVCSFAVLWFFAANSTDTRHVEVGSRVARL